MPGWFAELMQRGDAHSRRAVAARGSLLHAQVQRPLPARDARYDALVQLLRDREAEDRAAREKRQRGYRQSLDGDSPTAATAAISSFPVRLNALRAKVPCRATPEGRALMDAVRQQLAGGTVTFPRMPDGRQAVMITPRGRGEPRQIGWTEQCIQTNPMLCSARDQGLSVETDGDGMLVLRFRYPRTATRMSARDARDTTDDTSRIDVAEVRPALPLHAVEKRPSPRLLWLTRAEAESMNALRSRDYEAFYLRFKRELLAGTWNALLAVLSNAPHSLWHRGAHYKVVCEPDPASAKVCQRTVDDTGHAVDIGSDRVYDAAPSTDILLLHLEEDILADLADIYFTLRSLGSADAYFLKEEMFAIIRRFWASSRSLASPCGSGPAAVLRMAQGALPMHVQAALLKQDWTNLRQSLVDRYGEAGRKAPHLLGNIVHRPRGGESRWPFATFTAGDVNVGLRFVYRQATVPDGAKPVSAAGDTLGDLVAEPVGDAPAEIQNVVLIAEKLPTPSEIDVGWVRRHDWILGSVLLDESFRDALNTIGHEARNAQADRKLEAKRARLCEHLRANILHYQRAIWQQEDPQQRSMRYRKSGTKVPLAWRFELESSAALTIEELADRLGAPDVSGQFAAYAGERDAALDQVIDPVGPIGYYGNCAIYRMRPELAGADDFSMLHFFKSPYLRANARTGEPELAAMAGDDASDPPQVERESIEHVDGAATFGAMLHGWRMILENAPSIDLLRTIGRRDPETEWMIVSAAGNGMAGIVGDRAHDMEGARVILPLESDADAQGMVAGCVPDAADDWTVAARGCQDRERACVTGAESTSAREWAVIAGGDQLRLPALVAGAGVPDADERTIIPRRETVFTVPSGLRDRKSPAGERVPIAALELERAPLLRAGRARPTAVEWMMLVRDDAAPRLTQRAGSGAANAHDRVIVAADDDWLRPSLVAG